jgi:hypothetical protein
VPGRHFPQSCNVPFIGTPLELFRGKRAEVERNGVTDRILHRPSESIRLLYLLFRRQPAPFLVVQLRLIILDQLCVLRREGLTFCAENYQIVWPTRNTSKSTGDNLPTKALICVNKKCFESDALLRFGNKRTVLSDHLCLHQ